MRQPFDIGSISVDPDERRLVDLPISRHSNHAPAALPEHVLHELKGHVANPFDGIAVEVRSTRSGITIGRTTLPIVNMGDALFNIGWPEEDVGTSPSPERDEAKEGSLWDDDEGQDEDEVI